MNEREDLFRAEQALGRARRLERDGLNNLAADVIDSTIDETTPGGSAQARLIVRLAQLSLSLRDPAFAWHTIQRVPDSTECRLVRDEIEGILWETNPSALPELFNSLRDADPDGTKAARLHLKLLLSVRLTHLRSAHLWRQEKLRQWIEIKPGDAFATWHLARAVYALDEFGEAESMLEDLTARFPQRRGILNLLGRSQFKNGKREEAIEAWQQSLELDEDQPAIHFALGRALLQGAVRG